MEAVTNQEHAKRCPVCREEREVSETLRFVCDERGRLLFDPSRRAPGRGVSVCARQACLSELRDSLPGVKALGEIRPMGRDFWQLFDAQLAGDVLTRLGLLWRQRKLVVGVEPVVQAGEVDCVLVARDAGDSAIKAVSGLPVHFIPATQAELGRALGKDRVAAVAFRNDAVTKAMGLSVRAVLWSDRAALSMGHLVRQ